MAHSTKTDGKRVLTRELYGLRGNFGTGWSYEHLPAGTEFELSSNEKGKDVLIAHDDVVVESGDHVILFVIDKRRIRDVERLFQVGLTFF